MYIVISFRCADCKNEEEYIISREELPMLKKEIECSKCKNKMIYFPFKDNDQRAKVYDK